MPATHLSRIATSSRPLPRELRQVWLFAAVLALVSSGFVFAMTQKPELTLLADAVCAVGGLIASLKAWLTTPST